MTMTLVTWTRGKNVTCQLWSVRVHKTFPFALWPEGPTSVKGRMDEKGLGRDKKNLLLVLAEFNPNKASRVVPVGFREKNSLQAV